MTTSALSTPAQSEWRRHFGSVLLGGAIVLTSATQLRLSVLPIGPGEVALLLLAIWAGLRILASGRIEVSTPLLILLAFWSLALSIMGVGWLSGLSLGRSNLSAGRDMIAMAFTAFVLAVWVAREGHSRLLATAELAYAACGASVLLFMLALWLLTGTQLPSVSLWYADIRFRGWAENPNQLSLLLLATPPILLRRARREAGIRVWGWRALASGAVAMGLATRSDALLLSWAIMTGTFLSLATARALYKPARGFAATAFTRLLIPLTVLILATATLPFMVQYSNAFMTKTYLEGGQGSDRLSRWLFGVEALAESPVVGLGPGAFSGATGPFQGGEAHNSLIDWAASTGLLGVTLLLLLGLYVSASAARRGTIGDLALLSGLFTFSMFHYVLRQPVFWFILVIVLSRTSSTASEDDAHHRG